MNMAYALHEAHLCSILSTKYGPLNNSKYEHWAQSQKQSLSTVGCVLTLPQNHSQNQVIKELEMNSGMASGSDILCWLMSFPTCLQQLRN